jgi:hypothetical protein
MQQGEHLQQPVCCSQSEPDGRSPSRKRPETAGCGFLLRQDTSRTAFENAEMCPDVTKRQRQEETALQDEAARRNMDPE